MTKPRKLAYILAACALLTLAADMQPPEPRAYGYGSDRDPLFLTNFDTRFVLATDDNDDYNGYIWQLDGISWVPGMVDNVTWFTPSPQHTIGAATYYANGVMEATARWRGLPLEGFVGGVSLLSPADIGQTVWLKRYGLEWEGPFLVVDCARRADIWPVIYYRNEVVEVDFQTAIHWGLVTLSDYKRVAYRLDDVQVYRGETPPERDAVPTDLRVWWVPRATFARAWEWPPVYVRGGTWRTPTMKVVDGLWVTTPVVATDPATRFPQVIDRVPQAYPDPCFVDWRMCGAARRQLIKWGQLAE